jgi:outer membrane protein assembly factor BamA
MAGYDHYSKPVTTDGVVASSTGFANFETNLLIDTQDSGALPSRGTRFNSTLGYSIRNHSYPYLNSRYSKFVPVGAGVSLIMVGEGENSFGRKLPYYEQFTSGGFPAPLPAYRWQEFHANTLALGGGGFAVSLPRFGLSRKPALAVWHEIGRMDLGSTGWQTHQSTSVGLFGTTPLGPLGLVLSADEKARLRLRFVSGRF